MGYVQVHRDVSCRVRMGMQGAHRGYARGMHGYESSYR